MKLNKTKKPRSFSTDDKYWLVWGSVAEMHGVTRNILIEAATNYAVEVLTGSPIEDIIKESGYEEIQ